MTCARAIYFVALLTTGGAIIPATAATLAPNSLLCESDAEIQTVKQTTWLAGVGDARKTIEQAKAEAQLPAMKREYARIVGTRSAQADADAAEVQMQPIQRVVTTCAPSGDAPLTARVLEVKAISGVARVEVTFRGATVPLWTATSSLSE